ncbi:MAG: hypothetical protein ACM31L_20165 [Actinomycetota bacterium]
MAINWSPTYSVGIPVIDADRQRLISLINDIERRIGDGDGVEETARHYAAEMARHAALEIGIVSRHGYGRHEEVAAAHRFLADLLDQFVHTAASQSVSTNIRSWLDYQNIWMLVLTTTCLGYRNFFRVRGIVPHDGADLAED